MSGRQEEWILEVRVAGSIFFILGNEIGQGFFEMERVCLNVNERRKWSEFISCEIKRGDTRVAD